MVLEELAAQQAVKYTQKHDAAVRALDALQEITPWPFAMRLGPPDTERMREHWRTEWRTVVDVIPTSESALREAAFREANGLAPGKVQEGGKAVKSGFRDTAIWMSAVEYARAHSDESVYFVSSNTKDFGDGQPQSYRAPMSDDVDALKNFVHLTSLDDVVGRFTAPADVDRKRIDQALQRAAVSEAMQDAVRKAHEVNSPYEATVAMGFGQRTMTDVIRTLLDKVTVVPMDVRDIEAYKIGEHEWCTTTVRWLVGGQTVTPGGFRAVGAAWETRVLLTVSADDSASSGLTVLRSWPFTPVTHEEFTSLKLPHITQVAAHAALWRKLLQDRVSELQAVLTDSAVAEATTKMKWLEGSQLLVVACPHCSTLNKRGVDRECMVCSLPLD